MKLALALAFPLAFLLADASADGVLDGLRLTLADYLCARNLRVDLPEFEKQVGLERIHLDAEGAPALWGKAIPGTLIYRFRKAGNALSFGQGALIEIPRRAGGRVYRFRAADGAETQVFPRDLDGLWRVVRDDAENVQAALEMAIAKTGPGGSPRRFVFTAKGAGPVRPGDVVAREGVDYYYLGHYGDEAYFADPERARPIVRVENATFADGTGRPAPGTVFPTRLCQIRNTCAAYATYFGVAVLRPATATYAFLESLLTSVTDEAVRRKMPIPLFIKSKQLRAIAERVQAQGLKIRYAGRGSEIYEHLRGGGSAILSVRYEIGRSFGWDLARETSWSTNRTFPDPSSGYFHAVAALGAFALGKRKFLIVHDSYSGSVALWDVAKTEAAMIDALLIAP